MELIIGMTVGIIAGAGFVYEYFILKERQTSSRIKKHGLSNNLVEELLYQKEQNLKKVLAFARAKKQITNDEVERLLDVSNATAERYLNELENKDKLRQIGKTGRYTHYIST